MNRSNQPTGRDHPIRLIMLHWLSADSFETLGAFDWSLLLDALVLCRKSGQWIGEHKLHPKMQSETWVHKIQDVTCPCDDGKMCHPWDMIWGAALGVALLIIVIVKPNLSWFLDLPLAKSGLGWFKTWKWAGLFQLLARRTYGSNCLRTYFTISLIPPVSTMDVWRGITKY